MPFFALGFKTVTSPRALPAPGALFAPTTALLYLVDQTVTPELMKVELLTCFRSSFLTFASLLFGDLSDLLSDSDPLLDPEPEMDLLELIDEADESESEADLDFELAELDSLSEPDDFLLSDSDPDSSEPHYKRDKRMRTVALSYRTCALHNIINDKTDFCRKSYS